MLEVNVTVQVFMLSLKTTEQFVEEVLKGVFMPFILTTLLACNEAMASLVLIFITYVFIAGLVRLANTV